MATTSQQVLPDAQGRFGAYGGRYVPEILVAPLEQLEATYLEARQDPAFQAELDELLSEPAPRSDEGSPISDEEVDDLLAEIDRQREVIARLEDVTSRSTAEPPIRDDRIAYLEAALLAADDAVEGADLALTVRYDLSDFDPLVQTPDATLLDVRGAAEFAGASIPGAINIAYTRLARRLDEVPTDRPVAVCCRSGNRAAYAAAYLEKAGYDVRYVDGLLAGSLALANVGAGVA